MQESTDDQNNNLSKDAPLLPALAPAFANTDRRFSAGIRGKLRDKMIVMVRDFSEWDLMKRLELDQVTVNCDSTWQTIGCPVR